MSEITVYRPGAEVLIGKEIKTSVLQVCIKRDGYVNYEVSWFDGNSRHAELLEEFELSPVEGMLPDKTIGFHA
jgi:hypothetical protein